MSEHIAGHLGLLLEAARSHGPDLQLDLATVYVHASSLLSSMPDGSRRASMSEANSMSSASVGVAPKHTRLSSKN